ncbi:hypothetical protein JR316_0006730 [Psilocybe cubensis]|uniref:Uncharacterized protein n=2 Tax=Psilocybe cubensis TaxID=181762 RepID=A0A8H7XNB5_PSICU|nr:hypothetical protein JR316_0006730 [Psilocybe cubensis]KAH9480133.1 hypothetical protein JR316_0006730 [Psilocybe cubensis]
MAICNACQRKFNTKHAVHIHWNTCVAVQAELAAICKPAKFDSKTGRAKRRKLDRDEANKENELNKESKWEDIPETYQNEDIVLPPSPEPPEPPKIFIPPPTHSGRVRKYPTKHIDFLPNSSTCLPHMPPPVPCVRHAPKPVVPRKPTPELAPSFEPTITCTLPNEFGLYCEYPTFPEQDIDDLEELDKLCSAPGFATSSMEKKPSSWISKVMGISVDKMSISNQFAPFLNATVFRLMHWFYGASNLKSVAELDCLVHEVLLAEDFCVEHLKDFSAKWEFSRMDEATSALNSGLAFKHEDGWIKSTVQIPLPCEQAKHLSEDAAPVLEVPNVYHCSLIATIKAALQDESAELWHFTPHRLFWKPSPTSQPERVVNKVYNSDAFYNEYIDLRKQQNKHARLGDTYKVAIVALMLWSDST